MCFVKSHLSVTGFVLSGLGVLLDGKVSNLGVLLDGQVSELGVCLDGKMSDLDVCLDGKVSGIALIISIEVYSVLSTVLELIVDLSCLVDHAEYFVRRHVEVATKSPSASGSTGVDVSNDKVEGGQESVCNINLDLVDWFKKGLSKVKLGSEESSEKGSEDLSNNDGSKDSQEEWEVGREITQVKDISSISGSFIRFITSWFVILLGSSVSI